MTSSQEGPLTEARSHLSERVERDFIFHPARDEQVQELHRQVRIHCRILADWLVDHIPSGREQSLALTKIEEAMFWANAVVARNLSPAEGE